MERKKKSTSGLAEESFDWPSFETPIDPSELLPGAFVILRVKIKIVQVRQFYEKKLEFAAV